MSGNTEEVLEVLREVWSAQGQSTADVEEACGTALTTGKSCKRMTDVGFDGLAEETDGDLRLAWRIQLAREGKLDPGTGSVRDLVLGPES
jgi:hypothetical protein